MNAVSNIFNARAESYGDTMTGRSGIVSYKIPDYQRPYDWDKDNVRRLISDCLNGLRDAASQSPRHPFTFLGTVILTRDDDKEPTFNGESLSIVDGQQRLTTLMLLSSTLFVAIKNNEPDINLVSNSRVKNWLQEEIREQLSRLYRCTTGQLQAITTTDPFPRIVRMEEDVRGHSFRESQYKSMIADFLVQFGDYCQDRRNDFLPNSIGGDDDSHLLDVYKYILDQIEQCVYDGQEALEGEDDELPLQVIEKSAFQSRGCRNLFVKLRDMGSDDDVNRIASYIASNSECEGLIRLLLLSSYITQSVVLTVVQAQTEDLAFDIFDALNTTGEPLTALETLKPHVVRFERERSNGYSGSPSESTWQSLESNVIDPHSAPEARQRAAKELVIGFALYYTGDKIGGDLKNQRNILRNYFVRACNHGDEVARKFVSELDKLAQFRSEYWGRDPIDGLVGPVPERDDYDILKLCLRFISDTNTSTTIPILTRYWSEFEEMDAEKNFLSAVKAITAFLALRRAMTGGTARIDSDFRSIMSGVGSHNGLCLGEELTNPILDIDELKENLRALLDARPFFVHDKDAWINLAQRIPLANQASRQVCKFILLAASHNARPDENNPGLLLKEGIVRSDELQFLNHR